LIIEEIRLKCSQQIRSLLLRISTNEVSFSLPNGTSTIEGFMFFYMHAPSKI
jgi:hypothetical protein